MMCPPTAAGPTRCAWPSSRVSNATSIVTSISRTTCCSQERFNSKRALDDARQDLCVVRPGMSRLPVSRSAAFDALSAGAQFRDRIAIVAHAPASEIFRALFQVSLEDMRLAWWLGEIRYLPARLIGRAPPADGRRPFMETLIDGGTLLLRDDRPTEIVTGSAGQLHIIVDQAPVLFADRAAFDTFDDSDHEKLFMSIRVAPTGVPGEQWLVLE